MIFYGIICSTIQLFSNNFPFISMNFVSVKYSSFLFYSPFVFIDFWIEVINPSEIKYKILPLPTLFSWLADNLKQIDHSFRNISPSFNSIFFNEFCQYNIFLQIKKIFYIFSPRFTTFVIDLNRITYICHISCKMK
jgi:hypothetical protein